MRKNFYFYLNLLALGIVFFLVGDYFFGWITPSANSPDSNFPVSTGMIVMFENNCPVGWTAIDKHLARGGRRYVENEELKRYRWVEIPATSTPVILYLNEYGRVQIGDKHYLKHSESRHDIEINGLLIPTDLILPPFITVVWCKQN